MWIFYFFLLIFLCTTNFLFGFYNFPLKKFGDLTLSNLPLTNTTSSFSTTSITSTSSIPSTNRRSTGLHPYIYSRLWLFRIRTAASGTEAESICLFTHSSHKDSFSIENLVQQHTPTGYNCSPSQLK